MRLVLVTLLCFTLVASTARAHDQSECGCPPEPTPLKLRQRQEWVKYRLQQRAELGVGWPITGMLLGAAMVSSGLSLIAVNPDHETPRYYGGTVLAVLGVPVVILSATVLRRRVQKRRAILQDIAESAALGGLGFRF